jgi:hypothetical protein
LRISDCGFLGKTGFEWNEKASPKEARRGSLVSASKPESGVRWRPDRLKTELRTCNALANHRGQAFRGRIVSAYLLRLGKPGSGLPVSLCAGQANHADRIFIVLRFRIVASSPFTNECLLQQGAALQKCIDFLLQKIGSKAFLNQFCKPNPVQEGFLRHFSEQKLLQVRCFNHLSERKLLQVRYFNHFSEPKIVKEGLVHRFRERKIMKEGFRRHFGGTCKPNRCEACIGTAEGG